MRKIKMLGLAMGLTVAAMMQATTGAANDVPTCEDRCRAEYEACQVFCSRNPCLVPCEYGYNICLRNCGTEK